MELGINKSTCICSQGAVCALCLSLGQHCLFLVYCSILSSPLSPPLVPSFSLCLCSVLCRSSTAAGCLLGIKRRPLISVFNFMYVSVSSSCVTSTPHACQLELQVVMSCLVTDCNLSWVFSYCPAHFILLGINVRRGLLNPLARSMCPEERWRGASAACCSSPLSYSCLSLDSDPCSQ